MGELHTFVPRKYRRLLRRFHGKSFCERGKVLGLSLGDPEGWVYTSAVEDGPGYYR